MFAIPFRFVLTVLVIPVALAQAAFHRSSLRDELVSAWRFLLNGESEF